MRLIGILAVALLLSGSAAFADIVTLSLIPGSGNIQGPPGSVIGWGYSITNESTTNWFSPLAVNAGIFQFATFNSADYFDFPLIAPGSTVTTKFTPAGGSGFGNGLASLTWSPSAPDGFTNSGNFDLSGCWADSAGNCVGTAADAFAPYNATVTPGSSITPEPSTAGMALAGALIVSIFVFPVRPAGSSKKPTG